MIRNRSVNPHIANAVFLPIAAIVAAVLTLSCGGPKKPDPGATARTYGARASLLFTEGNCQGALAEYKRAYVAAAKADLPLQQARYLFNLGRVYYELGVLDSADTAFEASSREFVFYRDNASASSAAGFLALVAAQRGDYTRAMEWYERGRPEELKNRGETAFWLSIQAIISMGKDRTPEAEGYLDKAMECYAKDKMFNGQAQVEYYRASIDYSTGKYDDAKTHLASALVLLDKAPERYRRWRALLAYASVSYCLRDDESGRRYYKRALDCVPAGITLPPAESATGCPKRFWEGFR